MGSITIYGSHIDSALYIYPLLERDRIAFHAHNGERDAVVSLTLPHARRLRDYLDELIRELEVP